METEVTSVENDVVESVVDSGTVVSDVVVTPVESVEPIENLVAVDVPDVNLNDTFIPTKTDTTQPAYASPVVWGMVVALILFFAKTYGILTPIGLTTDSFKELTTILFGAITIFAAYNNPNSKKTI